jgi:hypothetical protein
METNAEHLQRLSLICDRDFAKSAAVFIASDLNRAMISLFNAERDLKSADACITAAERLALRTRAESARTRAAADIASAYESARSITSQLNPEIV